MPIKPRNRGRYPPDWPEISAWVRFERAGGRCECVGECGRHRGQRCEERHAEPAREFRGRVVLTTAHRDHVPEHVDREPDPARSNLFAACQRCHLRYDRQHHKVSGLEEAGQLALALDVLPLQHVVESGLCDAYANVRESGAPTGADGPGPPGSPPQTPSVTAPVTASPGADPSGRARS